MRKVISFTSVRRAELITEPKMEPVGSEARVRMKYTVVSGGTERACILGMNNTSQKFPMSLGYCGVGNVEKTGPECKKVKEGDRVLVYHGIHTDYNTVPEADLTVVENETLPSLDAAFVIIASMGLGGVRKLELEIGESAMVLGLGLLGLFSVQFCRLNGAYPVIAADMDPRRRELALSLGADLALDPADPGFFDLVKKATGGRGVNACVEVTGSAQAMVTALRCASPLGRISLLGCTRDSDAHVDYYTQVHRPGVKLIGAHNFVRPKVESYPHHWTHHDDCRSIMDLLAAGRINVSKMVSRVVRPEAAPEIYRELCDSKDFPLGTVFDWRDPA